MCQINQKKHPEKSFLKKTLSILNAFNVFNGESLSTNIYSWEFYGSGETILFFYHYKITETELKDI